MQLTVEEKSVFPFKDIPTLPAVAMRLLDAAMSGEGDTSQIAEIIQKDAAITAKVLQVANSPQYGFRGQITTLNRAVALLGNTALRAIALGVSFFDAFHDNLDAQPEFDPRDFWKHSLGVALVAEAVGKKTGSGAAGVLFVAGLLHDIGRLALYVMNPEAYGRVVADSFSHSLPLVERERAAFGGDHTVYGEKLAKQWNLPEPIARSIRYHHVRPEAKKPAGKGIPPIHQTVAFADIIVRNQWIGSQGYQAPTPIEPELWKRFGLAAKDEAVLTRVLLEGVRQLSPIFDTEFDLESLHIETLFKANRTLSQMSTELERRGQRLRQELMRSRFSESLHAKFSPGLHVGETLESAARVVCQVLPGARAAAMVWAPGAQEARVAVCDGPDARADPGVTKAQALPVAGETCLSRAKTFFCALEGALEPPALALLMSEGKVLIIPFEWLQVLQGALIVETRGLSQPLEKWAAEPLSEFAERAATALERAWLHEDLQRRSDELNQANQLTENYRTQMRNAKRLAAVGGMAAGVAHEINNPLSIIRGQAQLLMMREKDPDCQNRLRIIDEQSHRISKVLTELMGIARPYRPSIQMVNLAELLNRTLAMFRHRFLHRRIDLEEKYSPDLPAIEADPDSLQQMFLNLIINADHALGKEGRLSVRAHLGYGGKTIVVEIEDTGCGIPPENMDRIFEPFFTTKEKGKGTGLGLFTTYTIVENMSGDIQVRSEVGQGTCFTVTLPIDQRKQGEPAQRSAPGARDPQKPARILVVDDDAMICDILREALTSSHYEVDVAADGVEGTHKLQASKYDCVLLDLRMPRRTGVEVMQWLRSAERSTPAPPVIAVTGITDVDETEAAMRLGALACVKKPFSIDTVIEEIEGALAKSLVDSQY